MRCTVERLGSGFGYQRCWRNPPSNSNPNQFVTYIKQMRTTLTCRPLACVDGGLRRSEKEEKRTKGRGARYGRGKYLSRIYVDRQLRRLVDHQQDILISVSANETMTHAVVKLGNSLIPKLKVLLWIYRSESWKVNERSRMWKSEVALRYVA